MAKFFACIAVVATLMIPVGSGTAFAQQSGVGIDGWIPSTKEESDAARGGGFFVPVVIAVGRTTVTVIVRCARSSECRTKARIEARRIGGTSWNVLQAAATLEGARSFACRHTGRLC